MAAAPKTPLKFEVFLVLGILEFLVYKRKKPLGILDYLWWDPRIKSGGAQCLKFKFYQLCPLLLQNCLLLLLYIKFIIHAIKIIIAHTAIITIPI